MNSTEALKFIAKDSVKEVEPEIKIGSTVRVDVKIREGERERIQIFEGYVLKIQNGGLGKTFTVRRIASGVGVEKTFPFNSPLVDKVEFIRSGENRRAKLNYMRERTGKSARLKSTEN